MKVANRCRPISISIIVNVNVIVIVIIIIIGRPAVSETGPSQLLEPECGQFAARPETTGTVIYGQFRRSPKTFGQ